MKRFKKRIPGSYTRRKPIAREVRIHIDLKKKASRPACRGTQIEQQANPEYKS